MGGRIPGDGRGKYEYQPGEREEGCQVRGEETRIRGKEGGIC